MRALVVMLCLACVGCSAVKWQGAYAGVQNVSEWNQAPSRESGSAYVNFIWGRGDWSFQVEPIIPFAHADRPLMRLAIDRRIF